MKKLFTLLLTAAMLLSCFTVFSVSAAGIDDEKGLSIISWFTVGMTVGEAKELSPALLRISRNGKTLDDGEAIATGDTVTTKNADYTASVLGDVIGDGEVTQYSCLLVKRHFLNTYTLGGAEFLAADIDKDGEITSYDYVLEKRIYFNTYEIEKPINSSGVPVLLYHHILEDGEKNTAKWMGNEITIATSEFRRHLQMIKDGGYNVATVDEVVAYVRGEILLPPKTIILTFDDGYKSNTYYAAPILKEFGYQATMFSIMVFYDYEYEGYFDSDRLQHVTRNDLAPYADVLDQQCHTWSNHNHLSQQSYNQVYNDLMLSQNCEKYDYFAYPYGDYDSEVIRAVKDAGFSAAFTTVVRDAVPGDEIYEIPRYTITSPMDDSEYIKLLKNAD